MKALLIILLVFAALASGYVEQGQDVYFRNLTVRGNFLVPFTKALILSAEIGTSLDVGGDVEIDGDLTVGGDITAVGDYTVLADTNVVITGDIDVGGDLGVTADATVGGTLGITGLLTALGGALFDTVTATHIETDTLTVEYVIAPDSNINVEADLIVTGGAIFSGWLGAAGLETVEVIVDTLAFTFGAGMDLTLHGDFSMTNPGTFDLSALNMSAIDLGGASDTLTWVADSTYSLMIHNGIIIGIGVTP